MLRLKEDTVAWRQIEGEMVLLDLRSSMYLSTNAAATLLWRRLDEGTTQADLTRELASTFEISPETAANDVRDFLEACRHRGFLDEDPQVS